MSKEALAVRTRLFSLEFGVAWLIDAVFTWLPGFRNQFESLVTGTAQGQPATLRWWFSFWINVTKTDPSLWAILVALAESFIALSLLLGLFRKPMYIGQNRYAVVKNRSLCYRLPIIVAYLVPGIPLRSVLCGVRSHCK